MAFSCCSASCSLEADTGVSPEIDARAYIFSSSEHAAFEPACFDEAAALDEPQDQLEVSFGSGGSTFDVLVDLGQGAFDLAFEYTETELLLVRSLARSLAGGGAFSYWNSTCPVSQQVRSMDRIVKVNGAQAGTRAELVSELERHSKVVVVTIQRPFIYELHFKKNGRGLGLDLHYNRQCKGLRIHEVRDGIIQECNAAAGPERTVKASHRILGVNGFLGECGDSDKLVQLLQTCEDITMVIASWP
ncbi:unnamed protein product [Polarella glacialis]|uniref:PDZ domain-containing protein n=1 Tax=Polarella glacialis TaxID=89957 RepID=A0A813EIG5_POLGL|nr:unnamed protein product [Polarella glacialis]CAE8683483.1 unnamed protein product [Polarella glacialis]